MENNVKYNFYDFKVLILSIFYLSFVYKVDFKYKNDE